jgi:hypothetical protein
MISDGHDYGDGASRLFRDVDVPFCRAQEDRPHHDVPTQALQTSLPQQGKTPRKPVSCASPNYLLFLGLQIYFM